MAENGHFSDDISGLWGPQSENALVPPRPAAPVSDPQEPNGHRGNGAAPHNGASGGSAADEVARLASALAVHRTDAVSHAELATVRSEMEGAFTHQLAVALYDLLNASSDRFAGVEAHLDERLDGIGRRLDRALEGQAERLATLIESHGEESARHADARAQEHAAAQQRLSERTEVVAAEGSARLDEMSARITSVEAQMTALTEAVEALRSAALDGRRRSRRWGRSV